MHCLVLALALVLVLLPCLFTEAEAATASKVTVNGCEIPSGYYLASGSSAVSIVNPDKDIDNDSKVDTDDAVYLLLHVMFGAVDYPI